MVYKELGRLSATPLAAVLLWRRVPETKDKGSLEPELRDEQAGTARNLQIKAAAAARNAQ
jgi:hypothetical protein